MKPDANLLRPFFAFPLGAEVTLKAMLTPFEWLPSHPAEDQVPQKLVILERQLTECPGGYQVNYHCRVLSPGGLGQVSVFTSDLFWLNEMELAPYPQGEGTP